MRASSRLLLPALLASACARTAPPTPAGPSPLPSLDVAQVVAETPPPPRRTAVAGMRDPLDGLPPGRPVSLSASGVEVRTLLPALAEAAGVSVVLGPEVQGRVSVNLVEVPALEALRAVLEEAGLALASGPMTAPFGPVVFYTLPVDIDEVSAEVIQARFGVSAEVARWIVEHRVK